MLLPDQEWAYSPDVIGGKVGFTEEARHTMSSAAQKDGRTLIAVVMGCGIDGKIYDTQALFDFGFDDFSKVSLPRDSLIPPPVPVMDGGTVVGEAAFLPPEEDLTMLAPNQGGEFVYHFNLPESIEKGSAAEADATVTISGATGVSMTVPLTQSVRYYHPPAEEHKPAEEGNEGKGWWAALLPALLIPVIAVFCICLRNARYARRVRLRNRPRI
jgi:D-alanyl-D-alanine carboxypeptidase